MNSGWSIKQYLCLPAPSQEDARPDTERILEKLDGLGMDTGHIRFSPRVLRGLYPLCREADWKLTATLGFDGAGWEITRLEAGDTSGCHYGLCVDLGSTTIAMELVDMETGKTAAGVSGFNPQIAFGTDILTRIFYAKDRPERLEELRLAVVRGISELMEKLKERTGVDVSSCAAMVIAGNTTMIHFLLGMDAFCVFHTPYAVHTLRPDVYRARDLEIPMEGFVCCCPGKANYLGGDIISGLIAVEMAESEEVCVFLDIGTNGELVVGNREFLVAGAGAAGPALEGGVVRTGMRAEKGAVDRVRIRDGVIWTHILGEEDRKMHSSMEYRQGNKPGKTPTAGVQMYDQRAGNTGRDRMEKAGSARGICGSGIVDLLAQLFLAGWMDIRGKLRPESSPLIIFGDDGETAVEYAEGLYFYQSDIDEFLKTKAAASTMVEYMLGLIGLSVKDISRFYIAGAFGTHIDKESGVTIGLYPDIDREKIVSPGNTSLQGARRILLDRKQREKALELLERMDYVQFGAVDDFLHLMTAATAVPHTDLERYPSVMRKLEADGITPETSRKKDTWREDR